MHFVKNISCIFVNIESQKYGNVSLFDFFTFFNVFRHQLSNIEHIEP